MKKIVYTSVVCSALIFSNHAMADEFKDLRQSSANMSKEQAKEVEAGAPHMLAYYTARSIPIRWCPEKCAALNLFGIIDCPQSNVKRFNMIKH